MKVLRNITGMAVLTLEDGQEVEGFATLVITERGGMKGGSGTFQCDMRTGMRAMMSGAPLWLTFNDGVTCRIGITQAGMDVLEFTVNGPVDGL